MANNIAAIKFVPKNLLKQVRLIHEKDTELRMSFLLARNLRRVMEHVYAGVVF